MDWTRVRGTDERPDLDETVINGTPYDDRQSRRRAAAHSRATPKRPNADRVEELRRRALSVMRAR